jgi:hypothetical protein
MANNIQQEFENLLGWPHCYDKDPYGGYKDEYVQYMWVGWKLAYNYYKDREDHICSSD